MSSLAAARADNFYYGPDFDPKNGGINKVSMLSVSRVAPQHLLPQQFRNFAAAST